jgi:hypothetical protein
MADIRALEPYVSKQELARLICVSTRWVEIRVDEGLPSAMIGGRRKFKLSEVMPWLAANGHFYEEGDRAA